MTTLGMVEQTMLAWSDWQGMGAIHEAPFGALLRRMRRAAGLAQGTLAERAGYSTVYIGMLERGERLPLPSTIELLANALTLSDDDRTTLRAAASGQPAEPGPLPASPGSRLAAPPLPTSSLIGREREEAAEEATARFSASQQLYEELGDEHDVASSLLSRGVVAHDQGELGQARELYAASLERYDAIGHKNGVSRTLHNLANLAQE